MKARASLLIHSQRKHFHCVLTRKPPLFLIGTNLPIIQLWRVEFSVLIGFLFCSSWFWGPVVTLQDCLAAFFARDELKGKKAEVCVHEYRRR